MALPSGLEIGQTVQYLPGAFDLFLYNRGFPGPVAAIITFIEVDTISLLVFPADKQPAARKEVKYYADISGDDNGFKRIEDPEVPETP